MFYYILLLYTISAEICSQEIWNGITVHDNLTRQTMYAQRNTGALSCNHCCSGKAVSITPSVCTFADLGTQHAMRMRRIIICGLPKLYNIFLHIS